MPKGVRTGRMPKIAEWAMKRPQGFRAKDIPEELLDGYYPKQAFDNLLAAKRYKKRVVGDRMFIDGIVRTGKGIVGRIKAESESTDDVYIFPNLANVARHNYCKRSVQKAIISGEVYAGMKWTRADAKKWEEEEKQNDQN